MSEIIVPVAGSKLVTKPDQVMYHTNVRKRAIRGALTQGLAEYLAQVYLDAEEGGRRVRFVKVFSDRAVWETGKPEYPSASVKTEGSFEYDSQTFTPKIVATLHESGEVGSYLMQTSECTGKLNIEVWATDPDERELLVTMLEDALFPVEWMSGFRVDLPHYFGARAEYLLLSTSYADSPEETTQRYVKATLSVEARCPVLKKIKLGVAAARLFNETTDGD